MNLMGKFLIFFGIIIILIGLMLLFFEKIPYIGKLPGDIVIKRENITIYFPITTSIIISILLNLFLRIIIKR